MTAEIMSVGTELLLGNIVDTNAAFLAQELANLGVSVFRQTTVGDNHGRLVQALENAFENADMVIISGGLGPTLDDITKAAAAEVFGRGMYLHEESMERIRERFAILGRGLYHGAERNTLIPEGSHVLPNDHGSAPGVVVTSDCGKKTIIMLPGPPSEMIPMFTNYVVPYLQAQSDRVFVSRTLKIVGMGESQVEERLLDLIEAQTNPTIAPYAKIAEVHVRITASAVTEAEAEAMLVPLEGLICERLSPHVYSNNGDSLAEVVVARLLEKGETLAVAESCTGGMITSAVVSVSGCSAVLTEGLCTYSNEAKVNRLGVSQELLVAHGAVSAEVAAAMAEGVARTSGASIGVATTGVAGPDGGTDEKPVGLVYIGIFANGKTETMRYNVIGSRNEIRQRATNNALDLVRRKLI